MYTGILTMHVNLQMQQVAMEHLVRVEQSIAFLHVLYIYYAMNLYCDPYSDFDKKKYFFNYNYLKQNIYILSKLINYILSQTKK